MSYTPRLNAPAGAVTGVFFAIFGLPFALAGGLVLLVGASL